MSRLESRIVELLPRLRRYARSLAHDRQEADDLLQDCVENAIAGQGRWRGANLAGWLMAIMTNLNRNRHRHQKRSGMFAAMDDVAEPASTAEPSDPLERDRLLGAIDALSPDQRAVLMLIVVEGYSYAEIALMLDIPLGTVMSRLSRARRGIAATLRGHNIIDMRRPS
jgi:RNA polymerase sigma-70 factor (ECF subfamily)